MTFNPNIPRPQDLLSDSQGDLLANNGALNAIFSRNHIALDVATNFGKHTFIEMPVRGSIPAPAPGLISGEGTTYTKNASTAVSPATTEASLFYTPGTTGNEYQLTRTINGKFSQFSTSTNYPTIRTGQNGGWTYLPGGLLFQYGIYTNSGGGGSDFVVFPVAFTTAVFSLTTQMIRNTSNVDALYVHTVTTTQFGYRDTTTGTSFYWMAIGK